MLVALAHLGEFRMRGGYYEVLPPKNWSKAGKEKSVNRRLTVTDRRGAPSLCKRTRAHYRAPRLRVLVADQGTSGSAGLKLETFVSFTS